ncbi:hypothetical protein TNCV_4011171 [Trichonephila clavipes]|nr:hypothetical protein TNCV_4011171 [Trichonephila clavipes]
MNVTRVCETSCNSLQKLTTPPQFRHETGGEGNSPLPAALVVSAATTHKTFRPTDLKSYVLLCTRRVFGLTYPGFSVWSPML